MKKYLGYLLGLVVLAGSAVAVVDGGNPEPPCIPGVNCVR